MLRLVGTPFFNTSKNYTFNARSDDGVRVTVDGSLIIDKWFDQGATDNWTAVKNLSAGTHTVVVDYYERTGNAQLNVGWQ
jgi:type IV pilus assembly protein PilY1